MRERKEMGETKERKKYLCNFYKIKEKDIKKDEDKIKRTQIQVHTWSQI